ncbi:cob(I)yrinic acid a,c-diamide adenosyltransferase [Candidatus Bathyarchaeota archaeon]|nr:cob(I)yrinic acid a,c-diamide adenosyltransferase [Candidatus Bathyarchaeota archaeon]MBS7630814.1 cob(I)yrinic acid a,c-diamide adenosyltransferase [Candidatus Bathyarchaeota archaeon]
MGHIYLYYGTGGGKTTSALGIALRSVGHDRKVVIIQFMKYWDKTGEYKIRDRLKPYYEIYQFGVPGWLKTSKAEVKINGEAMPSIRFPQEQDIMKAKEALEFSRRIMKEDAPDLLILDEICLAVHFGLLNSSEVLALLRELPSETDAVLTGRYASQELIDAADFVNEIREVKSPVKLVMKEGIQY